MINKHVAGSGTDGFEISLHSSEGGIEFWKIIPIDSPEDQTYWMKALPSEVENETST